MAEARFVGIDLGVTCVGDTQHLHHLLSLSRMDIKVFPKFYIPFRWWLHPHPRLDNRIIIAGTSLLAFELMIFWKILQLCCVTITRLAPQVVVISLWALEERNAITINTNDVSGRSTPSAVSYDGKLRHVGAAWLMAFLSW